MLTTEAIPARLWRASSPLVQDLHERFHSLTTGTIRYSMIDTGKIRLSLFPHLQRGVNEKATQLLSIDTMLRQEIMKKKAILLEYRNSQAQLLGTLVAEVKFSEVRSLQSDVAAIANVLEVLQDATPEKIKAASKRAPDSHSRSPADISRVLARISDSYEALSSKNFEIAELYSKPSVYTRYWLPLVLFYFSASSSLRVLVSRQKELTTWVEESAETFKGFWKNWVIEPVYKILATIRHDEGSEVALLGKKSLAADMNSLERMVVEFAQDNPQWAVSSDPEITRSLARDGDLTPVLKAYEDNIRSPLRSAVTGSLVRSLLIQIQKTKVDVEIAINGIDRLLKSQELVFGFVGISPALLILWTTGTWLFRSRKAGLRTKDIKIMTIKRLRNIDRLLCQSSDEDNISHTRRGLVLYEVHALRSSPTPIAKEFREQYAHDLGDLEQSEDLQAMKAVLDRIIRTLTLIMS